MAAKENELPDSILSPKTREALYRGVRPFVVSYADKSMTVDLPGYYPVDGENGVHVGNDMAVTDLALRTLQGEVDGISISRYDHEIPSKKIGPAVTRGP